ncbi:MAG: deoxyribonuclease V [Spirochaetes bacterium]|nr:deoxyribonuclease V [Spirochaetota bacterium]
MNSFNWNCSVQEAIELQKHLSHSVIVKGKPDKIEYIAGIDVALTPLGVGYCIIAVFSFPELKFCEEVFSSGPITFPYVPGLLSFREGPLIVQAYKKLNIKPDILIFDGQGIAHPRRFGIASHIGVLLDIPAIGCAKSRLCGTYSEPGISKGDRSYLYDNGECIGVVLRTRTRVKPVFVSPGNKVGIDEAADIILKCTDNYRIPVPTRYAHCRVGEYKRNAVDTNEKNS